MEFDIQTRSIQTLKAVTYNGKLVRVYPVVKKDEVLPCIVYGGIGDSSVDTSSGSAQDSVTLSIDVRASDYNSAYNIAKKVIGIFLQGNTLRNSLGAVDLYDERDGVYRRILTLAVT